MRLWENAWAEFVPFLDFDVEIRKIICTKRDESVNARIRRAVKARGHFPNEAAALKCVYMAIMSLDPTGTGQRRWSMRWKPASTPSTSPSTGACPQAASRPNQHQLHRLIDRPQRRGGARVFTHASSGWPIEAPTT